MILDVVAYWRNPGPAPSIESIYKDSYDAEIPEPWHGQTYLMGPAVLWDEPTATEMKFPTRGRVPRPTLGASLGASLGVVC